MKNKSNRLMNYGLKAGMLLSGTVSAQNQILYTDVDPDSNVANPGSHFLIDLNHDSINDFDLHVFSTEDTLANGTFWGIQGIKIDALNSNAFGRECGYDYAAAYFSGIPVMTLACWNSGSDFLAFNGQLGTGSSQFNWDMGDWHGVQDRYMGLRLKINGQNHYGWIRLDVPSNMNEFTVKDYAVQLNALTPINTGDTFASPIPVTCYPAAIQEVSDAGDAGNGSDLKVLFGISYYHIVGIEECRAMVVKASSADSFNLVDAQNAVHYKTLQLDSSNDFEFHFDSTALDVDGDPIVEFVPYKVFILSVANGIEAQLDTISLPSQAITLKHFIITPCDTVENVVLFDIGDAGNGSDLQVNFNPPENEETIVNYDIFISKVSSIEKYSIQQLIYKNGHAHSLLKTGEPYQATFYHGSVDTDGDPITIDTPYVAIVMSNHNPSLANVNSLSLPSNEVILEFPFNIENYAGPTALMMRVIDQKLWIEEPEGELMNLALYDMKGALLGAQKASGNQTTMDISTLRVGIYVVSAKTSQGTKYGKVFVGY